MRSARPTQPRGDRRRRALLEAALRIVGRSGLGGLSHRAVAAEAHVPAGSITYYFASKEVLVTETLRFAAEREARALERRARELEEELGGREELVAQVVAWLDGQLRGEARVRLVALYTLQLEAMRVPHLRPLYADWTVATVRLARRLLTAAGVDHAAVRAPLLVAALDGLRHNQLASHEGGLSPAARAVVEEAVAAACDPELPRPAAP